MAHKNPKAKGSAFERDVCKLLSLWVSGGKSTDLFWRSAMSGGRATVAAKRGVDVRQAGDICAVAPEGHVLTDNWYIECKTYKDLQFASFVLTGKGYLAQFWDETVRQAIKHGQRRPMLIARQNGLPTFVCGTQLPNGSPVRQFAAIRGCGIVRFDDLLKTEFCG